MDPTVLSAVIGGVATIFTALIGIYRSKITAMKREVEKYETKIEKLETVIDFKDEAVSELRSQRDKLQVTAELQDKIWSQIERRAASAREQQ